MQKIFRAQEKAEYGLSFLLVLSKDRSLNHFNALISEYSDRHLLEHGNIGYGECAFNVTNDFSSQSDFLSDFLNLRPRLQKDVPDHHWV
jgi:hypothetical protein